MNDELLTFYFYNDGLTDSERNRIRDALQSDANLARQYRRLCDELERLDQLALDAASEPASPSATARWHASIDDLAKPLPPAKIPGRFRSRNLWWSAAIAAALVAGIGIGSLRDTTPDAGIDETLTATNLPATDDPLNAYGYARLSRGLQVHLRDSQMHILSLPSDDVRSASLIMDIVAQNRLFVRAAENTGSQDLARVLRAFEPILLELADSDISPAEAAAIRAQLTFELNVMLGKLRREAAEPPATI